MFDHIFLSAAFSHFGNPDFLPYPKKPVVSNDENGSVFLNDGATERVSIPASMEGSELDDSEMDDRDGDHGDDEDVGASAITSSMVSWLSAGNQNVS